MNRAAICCFGVFTIVITSYNWGAGLGEIISTLTP